MSDIDVDQVVEEHWPYDGPHDGDTVASAAAAMARLGRYLNNATSSMVLRSPGDLRSVTGSVTTVLAQLPQLLRQVASDLDAAARESRFYDDRDSRDTALGQETTVLAAEFLREAIGPVNAAARAIDVAHSEVYRLGAR